MLLITTTTLLREPPKALSTEQGDRRWHAHAVEIARHLNIRFDGEECPEGTLAYDVEAGEIVRLRQPGEERLSLEGWPIRTKTERGRVEVTWRSDAIDQLVRVNDPETAAGCRTDIAAIEQQ